MRDPDQTDSDMERLFARLRGSGSRATPPFERIWEAATRLEAAPARRPRWRPFARAAVALMIGVALVIFWRNDRQRDVEPEPAKPGIDFAAMSRSVDEYFQRQSHSLAPSPTAALLDVPQARQVDAEFLEIKFPVN